MTRRRLHENGMLEKNCEVAAWLDFIQRGVPCSEDDVAKLSKTEDIKKEATYQITLADLTDRLVERYDGFESFESCYRKARSLLKKMPEELLPNLNEWLDNKPLSDIKVHGISVNDILEKFKNRNDIDFIEVLQYFADWKTEGFADSFSYNMYFAWM